MQKKNSKLESFLFRSLPEQKFERIRGYESCIVVSERENKAFKYVVLGDEWIYLTENPPKSIQEAVPLGDVISVELVNDYPDFLMGDDKKNCQHIAITYWTSEPVKRRSFRKKKSPRGSMSDLHGDRSNASTPLSMVSSIHDMYNTDEHFQSSLTSLQYNRPDSRGSISSAREVRKVKKKKGSKTLHTIQSESEDMILKSLKEELEEDILEDLENQSEVGDSMNKTHDSHLSTKTPKKSSRSSRGGTARTPRPLPSPVPSKNAFEKTVSEKTVPAYVNEKNGLPKDKGQDLQDDDSEPTTCCLKCCTFSLGKTKVSPFCGSGKSTSPPPGNKNRLFSASTMSQPQTKSDIHIEVTSVHGGELTNSYIGNNRRRQSSVNSSVTTLRGAVEQSFTHANDDPERRSVLSMASVSDFGGSMQRLSLLGTEGIHGIAEKRRAVVNLYLLSSNSPMLMLIRSAWSNCLLSSTLMLDPEVLETPKGSVLRHTQRGKQEMLFQELKRDLLKPENTIDDVYGHLHELKVATEKNFSLKRLFWKNADVFHFCVKKLQSYLPKTSTITDFSKRLQEFELVSLLIEILCMMFHESEIIEEKTQALKAERGRSVVALLMLLTCNPDIPEKRSTDRTSEDSKSMIREFTKNAVTTVFELFLMAKQANWGHIEGNFYNISWMVSTLEEIKDTEKFVARLIDMVLAMVSPSCADKLTPAESVLLYQEFFILETFLQYSRRVRTFICETYFEEFKYFVQPPVIMKKLSQTYPIYNILLAIIEDVIKKVIPQKKPAKDKF